MSFHVAHNCSVWGFDHKGLRQVQNCFVPDEDLRGLNVVRCSYLLRESSSTQCSYRSKQVWFTEGAQWSWRREHKCQYLMTAHWHHQCVIVDSSTHNERIERLWRDVHCSVLVTFGNVFCDLADEGHLDVLNHHLLLFFLIFPQKAGWQGTAGSILFPAEFLFSTFISSFGRTWYILTSAYSCHHGKGQRYRVIISLMHSGSIAVWDHACT